MYLPLQVLIMVALKLREVARRAGGEIGVSGETRRGIIVRGGVEVGGD